AAANAAPVSATAGQVLGREGLAPVEVGRIDAGLGGDLEERLPAFLGHGAKAVEGRVAAVDDAVGFQPGPGLIEHVLGHVRVFATDQGVGGLAVALDVVAPALGRGGDETAQGA